MKKIIITLLVLVPTLLFAQISDDFSDGDFSKNPEWIGNIDDFIVNSEGELQTDASQTGFSFLSTRSQIIDDATWEFTIKINNTTSAGNYAVVYLVSDRVDINKSLNGYCVVIGDTDDKIAFFKQRGLFNAKKELIAGTDKCVDLKGFEVNVKVTRSKDGKYELFRQIKGKDAKYVSEGTVTDTEITTSNFFCVGAKYTKSNGKHYLFDNIKIKGKSVKDTTPPSWTSVFIADKNVLRLQFSEEVKIVSGTSFQVDNGFGTPNSQQFSEYNTVLDLTFDKNFEPKKVYTLTVKNLADYYDNILTLETKKTGIAEKLEKGDLVINEILPNPKQGVPEYFELYNTSNKVLSLDTVYFGVNSKKEKSKYVFTNGMPKNTLILPHGYVAVTKDALTLRKEYKTPKDANIINVESFSSLSNSGTTLYVINKKDTTICDEVTYSEKWHHPIIRDDRGVSLEKINPLFNPDLASSWHSASFDVNYGTPGYKNSQYVESPKKDENKKTTVWVEPEVFSPDNDGVDDVCFIKYKAEDIGNTAKIIIFTSAGVKVREIASNHLLSDSGYVIWDGKTDRDKNVNPGIYVLYFEIINTSTGSRKVEKMPIVVSAR